MKGNKPLGEELDTAGEARCIKRKLYPPFPIKHVLLSHRIIIFLSYFIAPLYKKVRVCYHYKNVNLKRLRAQEV